MLSSTSKIATIILDLVEVLLIGLAVFVLVYFFIGQPLEITGDSMEPNLADKEQIIAEKVSSNFGQYERGDIVVFKQPENDNILVIKRVVGLPGESFKITRGRVYVGGSILQEPYLGPNTITEGYGQLPQDFEIIIPDDQYILLGDNRTNSTDSRKWGPIPVERIGGKAIVVFYPFSQTRIIPTGFGVQSVFLDINNYLDENFPDFSFRIQ